MEKDRGSNPEPIWSTQGWVTWSMVYEGIRNEAKS